MESDFQYIVVQAGGKGTRMKDLTKNKPKALVPVENLPMLFHLFRLFPDKKYVIIGDYKYDVLKKYLNAFAQTEYETVCASGHSGTCAGLREALAAVPEGARFMLIWCDLILPEDYRVPESENNIIGISRDFPCRWSYRNGAFAEEKSSDCGVAGHFIFRDKSVLADVPEDGELVRWLQGGDISFEEQSLYHTKEYGLYSEWERLPVTRCRPFNRITVEGDRIIKEGIDEQGLSLAVRENAWYRRLQDKRFPNLPVIYGFDPLRMERVDGRNVYEYPDIPLEQKRAILSDIIGCLKEVHTLEEAPADRDSYYDAYLGKTYARLQKVRDLVPFANERTVVVNGKACRNVFFHQAEVEELVMRFLPQKFRLIHGDCTFSNIMLRRDCEPVLIDPRGYFGHTELLGDPAYDWVKLYYSLVSNYDQFNLKRFRLDIGADGVWLDIQSNHWEALEDDFFSMLDGEVSRGQMKLLLAIIWLSLTTYAWEDYDSICGAFYNGLYYLEEALSEGSAYRYFKETSQILDHALRSVKAEEMDALISDCEETLRTGHKIIATGLGKNVPICEKFVGTMLSLGLNAGFLHTNTAVHGDLGMVHSGDLVIILTKSGSTSESVYLADLLRERESVKVWLLSFEERSALADAIERKLIIRMEHEGDLWDIVPNNSTTLNLIVLQTVAIQLSKRLGLQLERDFKPNHPGGAIGRKLKR